MEPRLISAESGLIFKLLLLFLFVSQGSMAEFQHGKYYHVMNQGNNLCLTSNGNDFRTELGVFLGQVTLEECDYDRSSQKWAVILWSKEEGKNQYWFYPMENGLNELTSVLDEDGIYPVNNFIEVTTVKQGKSQEERYVFKSLEFNQCASSQGKGNPITYESCDGRRADQQWRVRASNAEPLKNRIIGRSLVQMSIDLFKFTLDLVLHPTSQRNSKFF